MPRAVSYTPAWLSKPHPGHDIFAPTTNAPVSHSSSINGYNNGYNIARKKNSKPGPRRTIARRGTEVFTAVGKEIRWADLVYLKEGWEDKQKRQKKSSKEKLEQNQYLQNHAQGYRIIKAPVADDIQQLVISPNSQYLAILTTHTVHIAVLPESSHLTAPDTGPLRVKTYHLGPITHVTTQAAVASALWHPLGVHGSCLITVTKDAIVRVWELSVLDPWSFDKPKLSIDLKKLADGTSLDEDFGASVSGQNQGFTPDSVEMEVASACFAGKGSGGWSPMTLWIAMREGDVYALCPLLPEKWAPPPTLIPSLSVSIVAKVAALEDDEDFSSQEKILAQQQLAWMADLDKQEPTLVELPGSEFPIQTYTRPANPGRVPRLQGPFDFELAPEEDDDLDDLDDLLSDILVIGSKMDSEDLMFGEDDDFVLEDVDQEGLSVSIICLLTSSGRLSICLDLDGVQAQWLPKSKYKVRGQEPMPPSLLNFQVLDTLRREELWSGSWPMFSQDVNSRYSFFVTGTASVTFISLSPWVFKLENELGGASAGTDFRIDLLVKGKNTDRERVYTHKPEDQRVALAACTLFSDPDLGYFLLTSTPYEPIAVAFETPEVDFDPIRKQSPEYEEKIDEKPIILFKPRVAYQPAYALQMNSDLHSYLDKLRHSRYKRLLKEDVRLSPATLTIMTDAHKLLSEETHSLGTAAAELFRRCARLQHELKNQIEKVQDLARAVDRVNGDDTDESQFINADERIDSRFQDAEKKQKLLNQRIDRIKRKVAQGAGRELTIKEKEWFAHVEELSKHVLGEETDSAPESITKEAWKRYKEIEEMKDDLLEQLKDMPATDSPTPNSVKVPAEIRKAKVAQIMSALDRETALVEASRNRLEQLALS